MIKWENKQKIRTQFFRNIKQYNKDIYFVSCFDVWILCVHGVGTSYPSGAPGYFCTCHSWVRVKLHVFTCLVPYCDARYDFRLKTMLGSLDFQLCCREFMFYWCYLYLFTYTGVQHDFPIRWCSCCLTVTRRVPHVKQELLTLPELWYSNIT